MCGQKNRSLVRWRTLSTPRCPISSCNFLNTVLWNFWGRTSCTFEPLLWRRIPSSPTSYFFHLRRDRKSGGASCLSCRTGGLPLCLYSITFPMAVSSLWAWQRSLMGVIGCTCRVTLSSFVRFLAYWIKLQAKLLLFGAERSQLHCGLNLFWLNFLLTFTNICCSKGILHKASGSLFAVPGRYFTVKLKLESFATHRWPVALSPAEVYTYVNGLLSVYTVKCGP